MSNQKKKLEFEEINARDWTVILAELVQKFYIENLTDVVGWHYTDVIYHYQNKKMTCYRPRDEHYKGILSVGLLRIGEDNNFIAKLCSDFESEFNIFSKIQAEILYDDISKMADSEILATFRNFKNKFLKAGAIFGFISFLPQDLDLDPRIKAKHQKDYDLMVQTRAQYDKLFIPVSDECCLKLCQFVLKRMNISDELARFLSIDELEKLLSNLPIDKKELTQRLAKRSEYFLLSQGKLIDISLDNYFKKRGWILHQEEISEGLSVVRGQSANNLKEPVTGRAVVVNNKAELSKVRAGDILITPMTTPEYFYIIPKLKAIVTDEGGITCHAAIIARELKIPCIIGTKIGTKVLKDGDIVELDADKGIIKIINRAE